MYNEYESPLNSRYASKEMKYIFSQEKKFKTWRKLWVILAKSQKELGLNITDEQIKELENFQNEINYEDANKREKEVRHDVMSHIYAYGLQCENAKKIIHLGATSCYVTDNTDIILMKEALLIIKNKLLIIIEELKKFANEYKDLPTLAFTHFQAAQLTTVGKRACLWMNEIVMDIENLDFQLNNLKLLGSKGTTGTQASFMELFNNDSQKVKELDKMIAKKLGFKDVFSVSGQTYSRKLDSFILNILSGICQSATKFSNDIRLLQHLKEIEEPFEKNQIGSSAMAYKRNPMRSERIAGISRYVIVNSLNPAITSSTQWFERTLDDSSNKRISVSEAFLATDAVLNIYINVCSNLVVYKNVIKKHIEEELPFMATENIMINAVKNGADRQEVHEKIRQYSIETSKNIKLEGKPNDLIDKICADDDFKLKKEDILNILEPKNFIGRCVEQVEEYLNNDINKILSENKINKENDIEITI